MTSKRYALLLMCMALFAPAGAALAVSTGSAAMPAGADTTYYDPDSFYSFFGPTYTVVADPLPVGVPAPSGYTPIASLGSPFASPDNRFRGSLRSVVWSGPVDTLLFAYQVELDPGSNAMSNGYLGGWDTFDIVDSGVFWLPQTTGAGVRPSALSRTVDSLGHTTSLSVGSGMRSTWFYFETDAPTYQTDYANLIGLGAKVAGGIDILAPSGGLNPPPPHMPEPLTMVGVGAGVAAAAWKLRRRQTRTR